MATQRAAEARVGALQDELRAANQQRDQLLQQMRRHEEAHVARLEELQAVLQAREQQYSEMVKDRDATRGQLARTAAQAHRDMLQLQEEKMALAKERETMQSAIAAAVHAAQRAAVGDTRTLLSAMQKSRIDVACLFVQSCCQSWRLRTR